ncbi:hypothetical protein Tco_0704791 [Tanacetum coccineum]|uniref:Uncharacterized protein n=1 Tax=Tanacetum coccineum TaxID=301880 RepID=A0ABQ4Y4J8_9ASTR
MKKGGKPLDKPKFHRSHNFLEPLEAKEHERRQWSICSTTSPQIGQSEEGIASNEIPDLRELAAYKGRPPHTNIDFPRNLRVRFMHQSNSIIWKQQILDNFRESANLKLTRCFEIPKPFITTLTRQRNATHNRNKGINVFMSYSPGLETPIPVTCLGAINQMSLITYRAALEGSMAYRLVKRP